MYHDNIEWITNRRLCLDMKYAMISKKLLKIILATLIRTFIFKVDKIISLDNSTFPNQYISSTFPIQGSEIHHEGGRESGRTSRRRVRPFPTSPSPPLSPSDQSLTRTC